VVESQLTERDNRWRMLCVGMGKDVVRKGEFRDLVAAASM
jgi:hypothetical protein